MSYAIVADSSADLVSAADLGLENSPISFKVAPLKILAGDREWVDDGSNDIEDMVEFLSTYKGKSGTACPSLGEWIEGFNNADFAFGIAITSQLSGSYESAMIAKNTYEAENPGRRVHIVDSLSTGPHMRLIAEKLRALIEEELPFEEIRDRIEDYRDNTKLVFMLESLNNLANNGRVSPAVAKLTGMLGIRIVGRATDGTLDPAYKCRGEKKALATIVKEMATQGFQGGKVRIAHVLNEGAAVTLKEKILEAFPTAQIEMYGARGLDSFYAEKNGLLVGYEI